MSLHTNLLASLAFITTAVLAGIYDEGTAWKINVEDQISIPLNKWFGTYFKDTIEFGTTSPIPKVISREQMFTKEIPKNCKRLGLMDRSERESVNKLAMICNSTDLYEIEIDSATGKLKSPVLLAQFKGLLCVDWDWSASLNSYAVFCQELKDSGIDSYYVLNIVDREQKKVTGSSRRSMANAESYKFTDRVKTNFRTIEKSPGTPVTIVTVFDEPYSDADINIMAKANKFFLLAEVDRSTKVPETEFQIVRYDKDNTIASVGYYKGLSMEIYDSDIVLVFYSTEKVVKVVQCKLDISEPKQAKATQCVFKNSLVENIGYGYVSLFKNGLVGVYRRKDKEYQVCKIVRGLIDPKAPIIDQCNRLAGRSMADTDACDLQSPTTSLLKIVYCTYDKTKNLGIDLVEISNTDPKTKTAEVFKGYGDDATEYQKRFYVISDAFIDVYDKTREEELMVQGSSLPKDGSVEFIVTSTHQGNILTKNISFTQYSRFLRSVDKIKNFPSLVGTLTNYFRVPIGREYFSGNGIRFRVTGKVDGSAVLNAGVFEFEIQDQPLDTIDSYYHGDNYAAALLKNGKLLIVHCEKKIGDNIKLFCKRLLEGVTMDKSVNEKILAIHDTNEILLIITTYGQFITFNKVNHNSKLTYETNPNRYFSQVTFTRKDGFILASVLANNNKGEVARIVTYKIDKFASLENDGAIKEEEKLIFDKDNYSKASPSQESGGEFCPRSISFEVGDEPILSILNACANSDRRLLRFSLSDFQKAVQLTNSFIRVNEFKHQKIGMCADTDSAIVASFDSNRVIGIGYESENIIQNMGMSELKAKRITQLDCLGHSAIAVGFEHEDGGFRIATYFTNKLKHANDRLHSVLEFTESDGMNRFIGTSNSEGTIVYNVFGPGKKTLYRLVSLNGPELFFKSNARTEINDVVIDASNGIANGYFELPMRFTEQKNSVQVSNRKKQFKLEQKKYNVGEIALINGPVFKYSLPSEVKSVKITSRHTPIKEYLTEAEIKSLGIVFLSRVLSIGDRIFILGQVKESSIVLMKFTEGSDSRMLAFKMIESCEKFDVIPEETGYIMALSCFYQSQRKIHILTVDKQNKFTYEGASSTLMSTKSMSLVKTRDPTYPYLFSNLDKGQVLSIYKFYLNKVLDKRASPLIFNSLGHNVENGSLILIKLT
jgi:hypothetical protein